MTYPDATAGNCQPLQLLERVSVVEDTAGRRWCCSWGEGTAPVRTWTEPPVAREVPYPLPPGRP